MITYIVRTTPGRRDDFNDLRDIEVIKIERRHGEVLVEENSVGFFDTLEAARKYASVRNMAEATSEFRSAEARRVS